MIFLNYLTFILVFQICRADKNTIPVFMLDFDQVMVNTDIDDVDPNPFARISASSFANIIHDSIKKSEGVIIFIEDSLSTEDISTKDKYGTPFINLRNGLLENKVKYFPAVIEPYKLLNQIFQPQQFNVFYLRTRTKLQLVDNFKYLYIFFQDGLNETRSDVLRRHDAIIQEVIFVVRQLKTGPVVAFYTGKYNPVVVEKVEFVPIKPHPVPRDLGIMVVSSGALFRFSGVFAATTTRRALFNQLPMVAEETFTRRSMSTKMAYTDFELEFNFSFRDEGWLIDNVALLEAGEEVGRTDMGVGAPWNWSYVCGEPLVIVNTRDGSSVTISQYQIQPRVTEFRHDGRYQLSRNLPAYRRRVREPRRGGREGEGEGEGEGAEGGEGGEVAGDGHDHDDPVPPADSNNKPDEPPPSDGPLCFGQSVNCGPYFNTNILSGLMITALFIGITMYGVIAMMECKSNDKYEDPLSKAITHEVMH